MPEISRASPNTIIRIIPESPDSLSFFSPVFRPSRQAQADTLP